MSVDNQVESLRILRIKPDHMNILLYPAKTCWVAHCTDLGVIYAGLTLDDAIDCAEWVNFGNQQDDCVAASWADSDFESESTADLEALLATATLYKETSHSVELDWYDKPKELWRIKCRYYVLDVPN